MMHLTLPNPGTTFPLVFTYDPENGAVLGRDADMVLIFIERAEGAARLPGLWSPIAIPDPLSNPRDMAILLAARGYELPPELESLIPEQEEDLPPGAVA